MTWEWKYSIRKKFYSVQSVYKALTHHTQSASQHILISIWKANAPLKVLTFAWRLFQDIIVTKDALFKQSANHLFSCCTFSYSVWQLIYNWLDFCIALPPTPISHFTHHLGMVKNRKHWKAWSVIWLATIWALWLARNDIVFYMKKTSINNILNSAKVKAWLWIRTQHGQDYLSYDNWIANPLDCLNIVL
ncbi:hypothetical protein Lal_00021637 [Lupinus albus]|nr:hypothetical protein Lal_00021637 [Lupinus albus]